MGRPSIFVGKDKSLRVQGILTRAGDQAFEEARAKLAGLVGWEPEAVSDADVIEYGARGHEATVAYLKKQR